MASIGEGSKLASSTLAGKVKNTFLHFEDDDNSDSDLEHRPSSDPTSSRSSASVASLSETDECPTVYRFRHDLQRTQLQKTQARESLQSEESAQSREKGKKYIRPCKTRRDKFRKYVDGLKVQLEKDPQGFDCNSIQHPTNVVQDKRGADKVASIIAKHRAQMIAQGPNVSNTRGGLQVEPNVSNPHIVSL